ncbi:hypothetical protein F4692_000335 [Nocardioides cavernae]|uniref:SH3 domain-containing protein n=1 Tax=Nocardioides cavernae TaxID=1921566 RepID=A0A7Y9KN14_9ACTN|nr:hypothetical protein [Nocardioides cavernae]NYE35231.1 hypothetical protein [Nocardioides cavernae]
MRIRSFVAALACAGLVSTAAPAGAALPDAERARPTPVPTTATVTVDQLGPGSVLAVVSRGRFEELRAEGLARSLEVITPDGDRHPVWSVDVHEDRDGWFRGDFVLADWRPELHTALLRVSRGPETDLAVAYDVVTGSAREVPLPRQASTVGLDPTGRGVLMSTWPAQRRAGRVALLSWAGVRTGIPGRSDNSAIASPDGGTLVTSEGGAGRWWVVDPVARTSSSVATPGDCRPVRWLEDGRVLAGCISGKRAEVQQLRAIALDGRSTRLGARHRGEPADNGVGIFGDADVRTVQGRSWYESYAGCGGGILTRQDARGRVRVVRVPGRPDSPATLLGTRGDDLLLALQRTDCGSWPDRAVLSLFDPVGREETVLTRLGRRESWREVLPTTEVRAWIW